MEEKEGISYCGVCLVLLFILSAALIAPSLAVFEAGKNVRFRWTAYSLNWSGYVAATSETNPAATVTSVSASWVVPTVTSPPKRGYSGTWVGIGGFFPEDNTLIQVGTAQFVERGITYYFAWYEVLPAPMTSIPSASVSIEPGDVITASITWLEGDTWEITLDDADTPAPDFTLHVTYQSSKLSAEWIEEAPSLGRKILPLANFGTVTFSSCSATIGGVTGSISGFGYEDIVMVIRSRRSYVAIAVPSALADSGTSFTITYEQ